MSALSPALPALVAAVVASICLMVLTGPGRLPTAHPNARSLHRRPVPRGAGLAVWSGWLAGAAWSGAFRPLLAPLLLIIAVSFWDDRYGAPAWARLAVHAIAAVAWIWLSKTPLSPPLNVFAAVLAIVWMANLFNFMDGSDGLAVAMAIIGFGAYAAAQSWVEGVDAPILWTLVAAIAPCLAVNLPPARLFLGDVGAVPLGFVAAIFGISGWQQGAWPGWFPVLVFLPFVADASVTILLRLLRGATIWQAHREHFYQKLVQLGLSHRGTLLLYGSLMLGSAMSALFALLRAPWAGPKLLILWSTAMALLFSATAYQWRARLRM